MEFIIHTILSELISTVVYWSCINFNLDIAKTSFGGEGLNSAAGLVALYYVRKIYYPLFPF